MLGAMKIPRPTRRWFQFSLRALLVFVTLLAFACSWLAVKLREVKREEAAAATIEKAGGVVVWSAYAPGPGWLRSLLGQHFFASVNRVDLEGHRVTDSTLEALDAMNRLQRLGLDGTNATNAGLERLQGFHELKVLDIRRMNMTDVGLENIARLKQLEYLTLYDTQLTDAGLEKLTGLNKLAILYLEDTRVTDLGLERLQRMKQLTQLWLFRAHVTAAGVKKLQEALPNCKTTSWQ
jgi:hypothetical protein